MRGKHEKQPAIGAEQVHRFQGMMLATTEVYAVGVNQ